jgi:chemotaxis protein CheC
MKPEDISEKQVDIIRELINIGAGRGADVLNSFLGTHVNLSIPEVRVVPGGDLQRVFSRRGEGRHSSVEMRFSGTIAGAAELIFLSENASKLVELITGVQDGTHDIDEVAAATFSEVGNIIINAVLGAMSNELGLKLDFTIPKYIEGNLGDLFSLLQRGDPSIIIVTRTQFAVKKAEIEGSIAIFFSLHSFDAFLAAVDRYL